MVNQIHHVLYKTLTLKSETGKHFKYEIYQTSDTFKLVASISYLDDFVPSINTWVVIDTDVELPLEHHHPDHVVSEVLKHFNDNYANE